MLYSAAFLALAALAYWYWSCKFVPTEVRENAADFEANGAADDLQAGYHSRQTWSRIWPGLACCVVPAVAPALFLRLGLGSQVNWVAAALAFLSMAALIGGCFARYFTPALNLARHATRPDITEWYASPASKSWPDAAAWKEVRRLQALYLTDREQREGAARIMERIIKNTWLYCRLAAAALAAAAVGVAMYAQ